MKKSFFAVILILISAMSMTSLTAQMLDPSQLQQVQSILQQSGVALPSTNSNTVEEAEDVSRPKPSEINNESANTASIIKNLQVILSYSLLWF